MAISFDTDLANMLVTNEFATAVTYQRVSGLGDSSFNGIFDNETVPVDAGGRAAVHEEQPRLTCKTSDVPYIAYGDVMKISSVTYNVRAWIHDGTGETVVQLEKD